MGSSPNENGAIFGGTEFKKYLFRCGFSMFDIIIEM
jgi:hypothetical protein